MSLAAVGGGIRQRGGEALEGLEAGEKVFFEMGSLVGAHGLEGGQGLGEGRGDRLHRRFRVHFGLPGGDQARLAQ